MRSTIPAIIAFMAGCLAAAAYTVLLWRQVMGMARNNRAVLRAAAGFLARIILCAAIFAAVSYNGRWERLLACAAGFMTTRIAVVRKLSGRGAGQ